jgi:hypothetical protein
MRNGVRHRLARFGALLTTLVVGVLALAVPAQAASGGGCHNYGNFSACISYDGSRAVADFYMNVTPDHNSWCYANMAVATTNVGTKYSSTYTLSHTGHYGPFSVNVSTLPASRGSAVNYLYIYTCNNSPHGKYASWTVYYP